MTILTVTSPATSRSLLTAAELRQAIGISDNSKDAVLAALGEQASAAIARACGVAGAGAASPTLRQETLSETFLVSGKTDKLLLSRRPVSSIASIECDGESISETEFEVDGSAGLVFRLSESRRCNWESGRIQIIYVAGFETVPHDLRLAASRLVASLWSEGERVDSNLKRENIPGVIEREWWVSPSTDPLISSDLMDLLSPYKNHWIG